MWTRVLAVVVALLVLPIAAQQPSPRELFERARLLEESSRSLDEAITLYTQVSTQSKERELAATALLRVGLLQERLGRTADAERAFKAVVSQYDDQREIVRQAQLKLQASDLDRTDVGMTIRRLWSGPDVDIDGSISPDGQWLSFVDWQTGDLAVRHMTTGTNRHLTNKGTWFQSAAFALGSVISPDARHVAFAWFDLKAAASKEWTWELRRIGIDGSGQRVLYRNDQVDFISPGAWSPDGRYIVAALTREDRVNQLALIGSDDGSVRVLKSFDWRMPDRMSVSPDGRFIAYDFPPREDSSATDIYLLALDGTRETAVVTGPSNDFVLGWAPSGSTLLFGSDRTGQIDAWMLPIAGNGAPGPEQLVKRDIGAVLPLGVTRRGALHYGLVTGMQDVYIAALDRDAQRVSGTPIRAAAAVIGSNSDPTWSPDGRSIAYVSRRSRAPSGEVMGQARLIVQVVDTGERRDVTPPLRTFFQPRWSPDGHSLLVRGYDFKGREGLYLVDVSGADMTTVAHVDGIYDPAWSPDGRSIIYRHFTDRDGTHIVARDLKTGRETRIYGGVAKQLIVSPDGQLLAFSEGLADGVWLKVIPLTGGEPRPVFRSTGDSSLSIAWDTDSRALFFTERGEAWRIGVGGGTPQPLGLAMKGLTELRLDSHGRRLAFGAGQRAAEVWVIENFLPEVSSPPPAGRR